MSNVTTREEMLMRQAHMMATTYMAEGQVAIDQIFGIGYAKANPELLAAFMQTAARDFHTMMIADCEARVPID